MHNSKRPPICVPSQITNRNITRGVAGLGFTLGPSYYVYGIVSIIITVEFKVGVLGLTEYWCLPDLYHTKHAFTMGVWGAPEKLEIFTPEIESSFDEKL